MKHLMWQALYAPGYEHFRWNAEIDPDYPQGEGLVIGVEEGEPFRVQYTLITDVAWRVVKVEAVDLLTQRRLTLHSPDVGMWTNGDGQQFPALEGCTMVDLTVTPFTNTLPLKTETWQAGTSREFDIVYVELPQMRVSKVRQRYTCLEISDTGSRFRYKQDDFQAEITFDEEGFVLDYPDLFKRVFKS